jgi:hypothetical protein
MSISDEAAIANLLADYCELFDAGDFEGFAKLFERGRWFATHAKGPGSAPVRRWCEDNVLLYDGLPHTKHVTTNLHLTLDRDTANVRCYVTIWQGLRDFPLQAIFSGRYHDELARTEAGWHFVSRWALPDVIGDMSRHVRTPLPPGPLRAKG